MKPSESRATTSASIPATSKARYRGATTVLLAMLGVLAAVSVGQGFLNAIRNSQDLQWSPVSLLAGGLNPYAIALQGGAGNGLILYQVPPYLHILYIVILPLALLTFRAAAVCWAILSIGSGVLAAYLIARQCGLDRHRSAILLGLFLCGTPFRNTIGNGQTSLVLLLLLAICWYHRDKARSGVGLAIASAKYSLVPAVWFWLAGERKFGLLLISIATLTFGWLAFSAIAHSFPGSTLLQPFEVARKYSLDGGVGDIMTAIRQGGLDIPLAGGLDTSSLAALATSIVACLVMCMSRRFAASNQTSIFAGLCIVALLAFRHLAYDYVLLAPAAAVALTIEGKSRWVLAACVGYFWFCLKALDALGVNTSGQAMVLFGLAVNCVLLSTIVWAAQSRLPSAALRR
jgi:hypothetical protein